MKNKMTEQHRKIAETKIVEAMTAWSQALAAEAFDFLDADLDPQDLQGEYDEPCDRPVGRFLVIIWCKLCDEFHFIATLARDADEAMHRAWLEALDRLDEPANEREDGFSDDGGVTGLVVLTAIPQTRLPQWLVRHKALPAKKAVS